MGKRKITEEGLAYDRYLERTGEDKAPITTALIDMDGVLYDSMKNHSKAWCRLSDELGWKYSPEEFFLYEGMTGAAIIRLMMKREMGRTDISDEEAKDLYAKKAQYFMELGEVDQIDGTFEMLTTLRSAGIKRVLVTGSGQKTLLERIHKDYPGTFPDDLRVTAHDVKYGKPNPEPYLMGLKKAGAEPGNTIVIENAPLGVQAGHASGCFTVAVTTGPIPKEEMVKSGADIVYPTMRAFAEQLPWLIGARNYSF